MTWLHTLGGGCFDFAAALDGEPQEVEIGLDPIAWSLAAQARFTGHTRTLVSVAEHSVAVMRRVAQITGGDRAAMRVGLMHDAGEAFYGDVSSPLKQILDETAPRWRAVVEAVDKQIAARFGLEDSPAIRKVVSQADQEAFAWEQRYIVCKHRQHDREWPAPPLPAGVALHVEGLPHARAYSLFLTEASKVGLR